MLHGQSRSSDRSSISSVGSSAALIEPVTDEKWPQRPLPLTRGRLGYTLRSIIDFFVLAFTVPFIVLGVYVALINGIPVKEGEWSQLQLAMKAAVTAFPIVFAAVMTRLIRNIATWKLERGIALGHLEQLLGSSSVFGTVSTQVLLGSFNILAVGLFLLWALSPLGGQSSLHIVTTLPSLNVATSNISTFNTEMPSPFDAIRQPFTFVEQQLNSLYVTSVMAPPNVKHSPVDTWGNVKVPLMSHLASNLTANATGWYNIDDLKGNVPYTSLIGIPAAGVSRTGNTTFNMESSYFDVDCYSLSLSPQVSIAESLKAPADVAILTTKSDAPPKLLKTGDTFYGNNDTDTSFTLGIDSYVYWNPGPLATLRDEGMSSFIKNVTGNEKSFFDQKQTFLFQSRYSSSFTGMENPETVAYCNIRRIYVESAVKCIGDSPSSLSRKPQCSIVAVRDSQLPHLPSDITPFLFPSILSQFYGSLGPGQGKMGAYTLTEKYMNITDAPLITQNVNMQLFNLDKEVFSQRLTQVINTYYFGSILPSAIVDGLDTELPLYTLPTSGDRSLNRTTTGMSTFIAQELYSTNVAWLVIFLITGGAMFAAAALSSILAYFTAIPDVLGYVSSLTRDSVYFPHFAEGSTLDGLTRARRLKNQKVRLGDVRGHESVGLLAFSEADTAARAEKRKLYQ